MKTKSRIYKPFLRAALIVELVCFMPIFGQTLNQEYKVKQDYKNCKIEIDSSETILTICGKSYVIEESYYNLKFAVAKNGDYICILRNGAWDYAKRVSLDENRYMVCLRGGHSEITEYGIKEIQPAIWILRKR
jgi:hypothetical protein